MVACIKCIKCIILYYHTFQFSPITGHIIPRRLTDLGGLEGQIERRQNTTRWRVRMLCSPAGDASKLIPLPQNQRTRLSTTKAGRITVTGTSLLLTPSPLAWLAMCHGLKAGCVAHKAIRINLAATASRSPRPTATRLSKVWIPSSGEITSMLCTGPCAHW